MKIDTEVSKLFQNENTSQTLLENNINESETQTSGSEIEFGEFQGPEIFSNINLNYTHYNPIPQTYTPSYYSPNLDNYGFEKFSKETPMWSQELVNELKFRLAQPNAGLNSTKFI